MIMTPSPPYIDSVKVNQKKLEKMPIDWMESTLSYIGLKIREIDNRAKLPENNNRDANARLQGQANKFMAVQYRIGEEMNRRGRIYFEALVTLDDEEDEEDGNNG
jgi:hypothetical protein